MLARIAKRTGLKPDDLQEQSARRPTRALQKAAQRKEPSASYVLSNPLFRYLENDLRFQEIRESFAAQQNEARAVLAQVR